MQVVVVGQSPQAGTLFSPRARAPKARVRRNPRPAGQCGACAGRAAPLAGDQRRIRNYRALALETVGYKGTGGMDIASESRGRVGRQWGRKAERGCERGKKGQRARWWGEAGRRARETSDEAVVQREGLREEEGWDQVSVSTQPSR